MTFRVLKNDDPLTIAAIAKTGNPRGSVVSINEYAGWTEGCGTCAYWEEGFRLYVNGWPVFEQRDTDAFDKLIDWLTGNEEEV